MQFVVKYFSEIVMKSKPVRRRFVRQLEENLCAVLHDIDPAVVLQKSWDKLRVRSRQVDETVLARMVEAMCNTPGVSYVLEVQEYPLPELDAIAERVLPIYAARLAGRSFAVRCRRSGRHPVTSLDVEVLSVPLAHGTIIDIRHPYDEERAPLQLHVPVLKIPFYELHRRAAELDPGSSYMLYCGKGTMSRFHAGHLNERNSLDIKVYAP